TQCCSSLPEKSNHFCHLISLGHKFTQAETNTLHYEFALKGGQPSLLLPYLNDGFGPIVTTPFATMKLTLASIDVPHHQLVIIIHAFKKHNSELG
ncbi:hypothetical protein TSMEX_002495, partial [Taenia solium]